MENRTNFFGVVIGNGEILTEEKADEIRRAERIRGMSRIRPRTRRTYTKLGDIATRQAEPRVLLNESESI